MANGSLFGDIKSRLGLGNNNANDNYDDYEEYDEYSEYDDYDDYDNSYDSYMERSTVTTRSSRDSSSPRLVSIDDARESARGISYNRDTASNRSSSVRSYGRTMVDSSLPPTMTAEGSAAVSAASNRRAEGLDSLFSSTSSDRSSSSGRNLSVIGAAASGSSSSDIIRNSMQLSMPGQRQLQVIKPLKYDDAEKVTNVLKSGDVAIIVFGSTPKDLMKRILDFSFGAASALDATVECIANGTFAIARNVGLDDNERNDLHTMGVI